MTTALPHLLLLPGLACDAEVWKHQARALGEIATVQVIDYGASDSIEYMARVALERAPQKFALAGHSMGGRVAMETVRRAPERVVGLALLDTAYKPLQPGEAGEREKAERAGYVKLAQTQGMRAMARTWLQKMVHPSRLADEPLVESIVAMMGRKSPEIFTGQIRALLGRPDATPVLSATRCPTLVLCGREDAWSVLDVHRDMAARLPNARLAIIETCGHMATMERPEAVTVALAEWFSGLSD
ncbi:MAG TPA: alpha/beta hydrolase [Candidatus Acidoferrales bacterium]|jgi:pimeloyl-ACP methyl ester carboxylesterase|nr:alpha/beta hydrolase [Candidatus Acidoferrales bacterium]